MSMTLYGAKGSGAAVIEMALQWADEPYTWVEAATWLPGAELDALKRVNPLHQVPTLVLADGTVLSESAAILIHLGLVLPGSGLLLTDPSARAQKIRGLVYIAANCYAAISVIDYPERWCTPCDDDQKARIREGTRERLHIHWSLFADMFQGQLDAEQPGALEMLAAVVSKWSGARKHLEAQRPAFFVLIQAIERHPRLASVFARHWPAAG